MRSELRLLDWIGRLGLASALLLVVPAQAQTPPASMPVSAVSAPAAAVSSGPAIDSVEHADQVIRGISRQRSSVAVQYAKDQQDCSSVFFMTRCLDDARERRREALSSLRGPEIEANAFKRRARVVERDQVLEEKRMKSEQEASTAQRALTIREPGLVGAAASKSATGGDERTEKPPVVIRPERALTPHTPKPPTAPISPATQASNIASFDKKAAESSKRQQEIAKKKAEKERDRTAKKAREAAAQTPPATP